jgi:RimJ/RimL family protein N-acetyltransferase
MNIELKTKRLILRMPAKSDWKDIVDGAGEFDIAKMTATIPHPYKKKDALWFINMVLKDWGKTRYTFFIELKDEKRVIGVMDLFRIDKINGTAETGSWINKKYWRMGYITEAKIALNDFAFNKLKLRRLDSSVFVSNKASNATQRKVGYKFEGTKRKALKNKATEKIHDVNIYGLLKDDWEKVRPRLIRFFK